MSTQPSNFTDHTPETLLAALRGGDHAVASAAAASLSRGALIDVAHRAMRLRYWDNAAWILDQIPTRDSGMELKRTLARNLASLQEHRPALYRLVLLLPSDDRYGVAPSPSGKPTVIVRKADGSRMSLSAGPDPVAASLVAFEGLRPASDQGQPLGLCGVGDGYLLQLLASRPPRLFMDMQLPVFVMEPDGQTLLQCLMIHDYSGPLGPIEQERFHWLVGPDWEDELNRTLSADLQIPSPAVVINQGISSGAILQSLRAVGEQMQERDRQNKGAVESHYRGISRIQLGDLLGGNPPRQPRALFITTRFSTVLQYSTRDTADAFCRMGWDARIIIEPSPAHRTLITATRSVLAEFKPDLVFQLDHLRYEHGDLFPPNLPFICWIQDHLPNLRAAQAGPSVGDTDFVLTDAPAMYATTFAYPERQCIALPKLTRETRTMSTSTIDKNNDQITFVSNASHVPERIVQARIETYDGTPQGRALLETSCRRLMERYAAGEAVETYHEVLSIMRQAQRELSCMLGTSEFDAVAAWIAHPLNDSLYRQQALRWAASVAGDAGMKLCLYGNGWDKHPEFAALARGPVKYGPELELLTQSSRINLQIVPYLCLHQRLLDGLMAGGFFLIRAHTADVATPDLLNFLQAYAPGARTVAEARTGIAPELHPQFDWLVNACHPAIATSELDDAVAAVQDFAEMGLLVPDEQVLPRFDLTCFSSAATLRAAVTRSLADPKLCQQIQEAQRDSVVSRFTYDAGMRRAMRRIGELVGAASANLALSQASSAGARELSSVGAIGDAARRAI